jgi:TatD DNase family protein
MLIDTHCHVDQFPSPEGIVKDCEARQIRVIAVTNLPSHFAIAADRLRNNSLVSAALGIHPLFASQGLRELPAFKRMAPHADYIGEIGLDFSPKGAPTKTIQERVFDEVLACVADRPRIITLHSRRAEKAVLEGLRRHRIQKAIFHWFTGPSAILRELLSDGHFVSVNPSMIHSASGKALLAIAPKDQVLAETDGPFTTIQGATCRPQDVILVYQALALQWKTTAEDAEQIISRNFSKILK